MMDEEKLSAENKKAALHALVDADRYILIAFNKKTFETKRYIAFEEDQVVGELDFMKHYVHTEQAKG